MRFFYENWLGIKKSVISLFTCFVRISARNSVNHSIHVIPHRGEVSHMFELCCQYFFYI